MKVPTILLALALAGCSSSSQSDPGPLPAPAPGQVLTHTFSAARGEFIRVFLASGTTYEAELDGGGLRLEVRPVDRSLQPPRVEDRVPGASAGGSSVFTVQPRADGEYDFRPLGGDATRPLTFRLRALPSN
jgi:hypothetical protein